MTRGKLYLIQPWTTAHSCEFNGDMYEEKGCGHYDEVVSRMKKVHDFVSFAKAVIAFDKKNFNYQSERGDYFVIHTDLTKSFINPETRTFDFRDGDYFDKFFSDYLYFKNNLDQSFEMIDRDGEKITVESKDIVVFNFGYLYSKHHFNPETKRWSRTNYTKEEEND